MRPPPILFYLLIVLSSSVDIPMSEGPVNLNWGPIMKHINDNPFEFFQQGGWGLFLGGAGGVEVGVACCLVL